MIHLQAPVNNWPQAITRAANNSLAKSVNDQHLLRDAKTAARDAGKHVNTCFRYWHDPLQVYSTDWDHMVAKWRDIFPRFVNGTFFELAEQGAFDLVEEDNEYLANSQSPLEIDARVVNAEAAVSVWNNEYRTQHTALSDIKLVLCNTAIGNWIDKRFAKLAISDDAVLGYHPYTHWSRYSGTPQRAANDWADLSGLWDRMEKSWGIKPMWAFTEAGPFEGALDGWRSPNCLNGSLALYLLAIREWLEDVQQTAAYAEGRIYGFCLFTTGGSSEWKHFETRQPELNAIADLTAEMWKPGEVVLPPPPDDECYGLPRTQYHRTVIVIPAETPANIAASIFEKAWAINPTTVGPSYDDAGIGALENKSATLYNIQADQHEKYLGWFNDEYPGTVVSFETSEGSGFSLSSPVAGIPFYIHSRLNAPRDYDWPPDGIYDDLHEGVDITAVDGFGLPVGILAAAPGMVERVRLDYTPGRGYGIYVRLDHGDGWKTWYAHLSEATVSVGQSVEVGDTLGVAGSTGNSSAIHLHLTLQKIGAGMAGYVISDIVNPAPYFLD